MLPIAPSITNYLPIQTPLVNSELPDSAATRAPYDNVPPSVSTAAAGDNASANNIIVASEQPEAPTEPQDETPPSVLSDASAAAGGGAQATFIAQLISQDPSPEMQGILIQYEKLVALSNVKYKPSEAFRPPAAPSGVFGRIIQQEKAVKTVEAPAQPEPINQAAPAPQTDEAIVSAAATELPVKPEETQEPPAPANTAANDNSDHALALTAQANSAYAANAQRFTSSSSENLTA